MRAVQNILTPLFALFACAIAAEESYDATVYITSTVRLVNTVTMSGASPTGSVPVETSTIATALPTGYPAVSSNGTVASTGSIAPTGTLAQPPQSEFTGAASAVNAPALAAALAAGMGFLVL